MVNRVANGKLYLVPTPLDFGTAQAQPLAQVLPEQTMQTAASLRHWGVPSASCGVGGTIPFMGMLGDPMPDAQFLLIGVLGPESNAHGPDEFLHIPTVQRVTATVCDVLAAHGEHFG